MGTREEEDAPLPIEVVVDHRGQPIFSRSAAGVWPSAVFIIGKRLPPPSSSST
ncbi:unnamed protein product [Spirodela intermedia]|uniref:Uncharacterized protein n=1 Tax=Spirodela intermedia TaxID=51605 RepID=A0ABN7E911_SPIIN|nr:unnamed protein product [Spirodela intermedia]